MLTKFDLVSKKFDANQSCSIRRICAFYECALLVLLTICCICLLAKNFVCELKTWPKFVMLKKTIRVKT